MKVPGEHAQLSFDWQTFKSGYVPEQEDQTGERTCLAVTYEVIIASCVFSAAEIQENYDVGAPAAVESTRKAPKPHPIADKFPFFAADKHRRHIVYEL